MVDSFINVCFATIILPFLSIYGPRYARIPEQVIDYLVKGSLVCNIIALILFPYAFVKFRKSTMDNIWHLFLYFNAMAYASKLSLIYKQTEWVDIAFKITKRGCQFATFAFFTVLIIRYFNSIRSKFVEVEGKRPVKKQE